MILSYESHIPCHPQVYGSHPLHTLATLDSGELKVESLDVQLADLDGRLTLVELEGGDEFSAVF